MYSLPDIIRVIKVRWMSWVGNVTHMEGRRNVCRCTGGEPEGKRPHIKNLVIDGRIILNGFLKKWDDKAWTGFV
jgi:hypothetical protein